MPTASGRSRPTDRDRARRGGAVGRGIRANAVGLLVTLLVQVGAAPVHLHAVGVQRYGEWLVLTAVPAYLSLTDLGFAAASATLATRRLAAGSAAGAARALASGWAVVTVLSTAVGAAGLAVFAASGAAERFPLLGRDAVLVVGLQLAWAALWMQLGFVEGAFRADGQYPRGVAYVNAGRVVEFAALVAALLLWRDLVVLAAVLLAVRASTVLVLHRLARRHVPWFRLGPGHVERSTARELLVPSVTYAGFTVGAALLNQGAVLVVGHLLGHVQAVTFTTVRTAVNLVGQLSLVVTTGALPELTRRVAVGDLSGARRIQRRTLALALGSTVPAATAVAVLGPAVVSLWTSGAVDAPRSLVLLTALGTVVRVPWQVAANALRAANAHQRAGVGYLAACVLALAAAWLLVPRLGLAGVPAALLLVDLVMLPLCAAEQRASRRTAPAGAGR